MATQPLTCDLNPETIFSYDNHQNIPWNIVEYQPNRQFIDARQQIKNKEYLTQKKGQKNNNYLTRRGFYMDYTVKVAKGIPSSVEHSPRDPWDQTDNQKKSKFNKLDKSLSKMTYLDRIQIEQKNRKTPEPGTYNLNKTQAEIKKINDALKTKKRFIGDKHFFFQDGQYVSNQIPGAGQHNPHIEVPHYRINKTDHKVWISKHAKENEKLKKRRSVQPAAGTYTPIPNGTFDRMRTADEARKKKKSPFNGFGSDSKFEYTRPNKKKIIQQRPAPSAYNMVLQWKGKDMELKKNNWIRSRSTGLRHSVYH